MQDPAGPVFRNPAGRASVPLTVRRKPEKRKRDYQLSRRAEISVLLKILEDLYTASKAAPYPKNIARAMSRDCPPRSAPSLALRRGNHAVCDHYAARSDRGACGAPAPTLADQHAPRCPGEALAAVFRDQHRVAYPNPFGNGESRSRRRPGRSFVRKVRGSSSPQTHPPLAARFEDPHKPNPTGPQMSMMSMR